MSSPRSIAIGSEPPLEFELPSTTISSADSLKPKSISSGRKRFLEATEAFDEAEVLWGAEEESAYKVNVSSKTQEEETFMVKGARLTFVKGTLKGRNVRGDKKSTEQTKVGAHVDEPKRSHREWGHNTTAIAQKSAHLAH